MAPLPHYSQLDRLIHRVAFGAPAVQMAAADIESALFGSSYRDVVGERPIFITSLPRAGTTVMLEALHRFPSLAAHVYRDMPFVLAPVLWARLTSSFRKPSELRERAHGDGIEVGYDSPEAFEEILWRAFWPEKFSESRIALWSAGDERGDARGFFLEHMKKIIALRRPDRPGDGRYVSKNNANVARLDLIGRLFPGATILVPVRQPLEHARSLLRQHRNFLTMHQEVDFVRRYMADIGHYEFGALHRPIAFPDLEKLTDGRDPLTIDYWLGYWIAAFEHVLSRQDKVVLVCYEACCSDPTRAVAKICERLDIDDEGALPRVAALFKEPPASRGTEVDVDRQLLLRAGELYATLCDEERSIVPIKNGLRESAIF